MKKIARTLCLIWWGNIRMRWDTAFYRMQLETGKAGENKPRIYSRGRGAAAGGAVKACGGKERSIV